MKVLQWLLGAGLLAGLLLVGGSLLLPAQTRVERSILIAQPPERIFAVLDSFQHFNAWSPWVDLDPRAHYSYSGPVSGPGARMAWQGAPAMGSGSQRIVSSLAPERVDIELSFGEQQAMAQYLLRPEGPVTRVTWRLESKHGYNPLSRWFGLLLDRMIGPDFERGLQRLKQRLEAEGRTTPAAAGAPDAG